jgi:hypothetical protein
LIVLKLTYLTDGDISAAQRFAKTQRCAGLLKVDCPRPSLRISGLVCENLCMSSTKPKLSNLSTQSLPRRLRLPASFPGVVAPAPYCSAEVLSSDVDVEAPMPSHGAEAPRSAVGAEAPVPSHGAEAPSSAIDAEAPAPSRYAEAPVLAVDAEANSTDAPASSRGAEAPMLSRD